MTASKFDTVKKKLIEALLSDEVTPSAATRISGMVEELGHESITEKRLVAMDRELEDIMANLTGPTVDEIKSKVARGELGISEMAGYSTSGSFGKGAEKSRRYVPVISGAICVIIALFIFYKFSGLWTYIVAGLLLMLAWGSIKTGLFASDKEIRELTEPGPVSEDTKKKFQDKLR
jgi:hypothetical protein